MLSVAGSASQVSAARREHAMRTNFGFGRFFQLVTRRRPASRGSHHMPDMRVRTNWRDAAKCSNSCRQCCRRLCRARGCVVAYSSLLNGARGSRVHSSASHQCAWKSNALQTHVNRFIGN